MNQPDLEPELEMDNSKPPHAMNAERVVSELSATATGLTIAEVSKRQQQYGANSLPRKEPASLFEVFLNQFKSPLIYVLVAAALVSLVIREFSDAIFISAVLLLNAVIGTVQEFSAQRSADALQKMMMTQVSQALLWRLILKEQRMAKLLLLYAKFVFLSDFGGRPKFRFYAS